MYHSVCKFGGEEGGRENRCRHLRPRSRSEKNTNWEGAFRIPLLVRWPGKIKPGQISREIVQHHDWFPTFMAIAGEPDIVAKAKKGYQAIGRTYKNHIDGYNLLHYLTDEQKKSPRNLFVYLSDDGDVLGVRMTTGNASSWNSAAQARWMSGWSLSRDRGCRRSTIFAPIPMNFRRSPRTVITNGSCTKTI